MAIQTIYSFSVKAKDSSGRDIIKKAKAYCEREGKSFSFLVLKAITKYLEEVLKDADDE